MKHTYQIKGMTCDGCRTHVEQALSKADGVSTVSVDLKKATAAIEMAAHIPLENFSKSSKKVAAITVLHFPVRMSSTTIIRCMLQRVKQQINKM